MIQKALESTSLQLHPWSWNLANMCIFTPTLSWNVYSCHILRFIYSWGLSLVPLEQWSFFFFFFFFFFFCILGPYLRHMEVPRLRVTLELLLPVYTTAIAMQDPTLICNLHHSSRQCQSLIHSARSGIKPATSWLLVGFVSSAPQWKLQEQWFLNEIVLFLREHLAVSGGIFGYHNWECAAGI